MANKRFTDEASIAETIFNSSIEDGINQNFTTMFQYKIKDAWRVYKFDNYNLASAFSNYWQTEVQIDREYFYVNI